MFTVNGPAAVPPAATRGQRQEEEELEDERTRSFCPHESFLLCPVCLLVLRDHRGAAPAS